MRRVRVDGTTLFVRTYGPAGVDPVLLLHGACADGPTDWGMIAPALAARRQVIVPDLRGHGRSPDPAGGYAFARLAADVVELVRAQGLDKVHLVGHSNGGNVALTVLVEHPEVIASCVIQGGNAWVSPNIATSSRAAFDPERIDREEPEWRAELERLHDRWQGPGAWRALVVATGIETATSPAYTPADLGAVRRPVLIIEGRRDRLNSRAGHGAFLARHIPDAELWRPEDTGHRVHAERAVDWLARVERFWLERGTPTRDGLWRLGHGPYADRRTRVFDVRLAARPASPDQVTVLDADEARLVRSTVMAPRRRLVVRALRSGARPGWAYVPVVDVLEAPEPGASRSTQALFGEPLEILDRRGEWLRVRMDADGYVGWVRSPQVREASAPGAVHRVRVPVIALADQPDGAVVVRLPLAARVAALAQRRRWTEVAGPAGVSLWAPSKDLAPGDQGPLASDVLDLFCAFVGVPYLWGGRSAWGWDCSGLVQAYLAARGIAAPRDCDQQWMQGRPVGPAPRAGDLLFFADPGPGARTASHVAIALGDGQILHAHGPSGRVVITGVAAAISAPGTPRGRRLLGLRRYEEPKTNG